MDFSSNLTGILFTNTSEDPNNITEDDYIQSLAESYMMYKIGLWFLTWLNLIQESKQAKNKGMKFTEDIHFS